MKTQVFPLVPGLDQGQGVYTGDVFTQQQPWEPNTELEVIEGTEASETSSAL